MTLLLEEMTMKFDCSNNSPIERHDFLIYIVYNRVFNGKKHTKIDTSIIDRKNWCLSRFRMIVFQTLLSFFTVCLCTVTTQVQDANDYDEIDEGKTIFSLVCWS